MSQSEAQMLRELQESILFEPGFPKRLGYTHAQMASLSKEEARARHEPQREAIEQARASHAHLSNLARKLGDLLFHRSFAANG
jgi:hypothetical protein